MQLQTSQVSGIDNIHTDSYWTLLYYTRLLILMK